MTNPKQAVILSGGWANGAYEIGILKALFTRQCPATRPDPLNPDSKPEILDPDIFAGTPVDAFNAAYLVSRLRSYREIAKPGTVAMADLEKVWLEDLSNQSGTVNEAIELQRALKDTQPDQAEAVSRVTSFLIDNPEEARELTIHRYHPHDPLGGALGVLDFRRDRIQALIDRGFADAVSHDCDRSGCVIPGATKIVPEECRHPLRFNELTADIRGGTQ